VNAPKTADCSLDQLYSIATGPSIPDWRIAFIRSEDARKELLAHLALAQARIAELEAADPMATVIAAATELTKLTPDEFECPTQTLQETTERAERAEAKILAEQADDARMRAEWDQLRAATNIRSTVTRDLGDH